MERSAAKWNAGQSRFAFELDPIADGSAEENVGPTGSAAFPKDVRAA